MSVPAFAGGTAAPLFDRDLAPYLLTAFADAHSRIWANMFFADVRLYEDPNRVVRDLLDELAYAAWRGVDVRLVISPTDAEDMEAGNGTSAFYLDGQGVDVRWFRRDGFRSTHSKTVIIDHDLSVIGSCNWTDRGLTRSVEAGLMVNSTDIASAMTEDFLRTWDSSLPMERE
ncbi:MAG: phospholipase D-like domain-containing protein [Pseudomonadota bacterium]